MINNRFRQNWLKILDYNANIDLEDKFKLTEEKVRIPLTPLEINPYILYYLFEILYPKFIASQQNILDIIISDDGRNILKSYLYKTRKAGIHEALEILPEGTIKVRRRDFKDLDKFYNRILDRLIKENKERVSSIRIFKEQAISYINQYCLEIEDLPLDILFRKFLVLIQKLIEENIFIIYPEPRIYSFLKNIIKFLNRYRLDNFFKITYSLLPDFNFSFIFGSKEQIIIMHLQKIYISNLKKPYLRLNLFIPDDLGIKIEGLDENEILDVINERLHTDRSYYFYQRDVISLLTEITNLPANIEKENLLLILQKILFGVRSFEKHWFLKPKPRLYNNFLRFLIRILGFNINLRKFSHWGIIESISSFLDNWFGLNFKLLVIVTNIHKSKNLNMRNFNYLKDVSVYNLLFEIENKVLAKINSIKKEELFNKQNIKSLETIRYKVSEKFGFLSNIIIIDKQMIQKLINHFIFDHTKYSPFSKIKALKMLKKQKFFYIFPEIPPYRFIRKKGTISLLKLILPILIDKHEF